MRNPPKLLTKSRFKVGYECPTKLYFLNNKEYGNLNTDNAFLRSLAEGGFQVGALAQQYHPGGIEIETLDTGEAHAQTLELLKRDKVTIYEAALRWRNCLVRVDVLVKQGNRIDLIEVKAKSFNPEDDCFYDKRLLKKNVHKLTASWEPYLLDIAFQTFVARNAMPDMEIHPWLMMADTTRRSTVEGLNQRFMITEDEGGRVKILVDPKLDSKSLGGEVLSKFRLDEEVARILSSPLPNGRKFEAFVDELESYCQSGERAPIQVGPDCKSCEFRIKEAHKSQGLRSGFDECWTTHPAFDGVPPHEPLVFDIWAFTKSKQLLEAGIFRMKDVTEEDIGVKENENKEGLSRSQRQWLQVRYVTQGEKKPFIDHNGLAEEFNLFKSPLHFIDFETAMVAIPFNAGRRPYEQLAFQFSHHVLREDGRIEHKDQFLFDRKGEFPNFEFIRALKRSLEGDRGTIFRYSHHENTVLCQILEQLEALDPRLPDHDELAAFIKDVTTKKSSSSKEEYLWKGDRKMVDLCDLVQRYYYDPATQGSNSIKAVLPAILNASSFLKERYSQPIYGGDAEIRSLNLSEPLAWIRIGEDGRVKDPYKSLPKVWDEYENETLETVVKDPDLKDGAAAMTAYARMQFTQMSDLERQALRDALLRYCELDTFAMVLLYQYWRSELDVHLGNKRRPPVPKKGARSSAA